MGSRLPHLLLELVAEIAVVADVAEILEERAGRKEKKDEQEPAAALIRIAAHLPEADRDDERGKRSEDGERRKVVAVDRGLQDEVRGGSGCQQRQEPGREDPIPLRRP